jgi:hypothetical protein
VRTASFAPILLFLALPACIGVEVGGDDGELRVWPENINLGLTDDGMKFRVPVGASGGSGLEWGNMRADFPRFAVAGDDELATLTAEFPGADELRVEAADGQMIAVPVTVISYPVGAVARGRAAVERIGCQKSGCHDMNGPDFTPSRIGGFDDRDVSAWILQGKSLKTGATVPDHAWPLTIGEEQDVVAYLRSLPPRGAPVMH